MWPPGFTCVIMALVNLASSQVFLPTEVVTSRADREGASRLDLLRVFTCRDKRSASERMSDFSTFYQPQDLTDLTREIT